ncbi:Uncharacterized protein SVXHx_3162 (plasmid) [Haloferax volcanii]|nr:Uncharacterized protein SVXHx_3162 [Haloferax lucentense]
MTVFSGGEAIREFLAEFDGWLSESVDVYLLGGSAMTVQGLKDQTEDIDLALVVSPKTRPVLQRVRNRVPSHLHPPLDNSLVGLVPTEFRSLDSRISKSLQATVRGLY